MFEHYQNGVQVISWIAHFKDAGQRIVRGIWALQQFEKDATPTIGDHTIDWPHGIGASKHLTIPFRRLRQDSCEFPRDVL